MNEPPLPALRASDADRERAADTLRRAGGVGQLDLDELGERLDAVYTARTQGGTHVRRGRKRSWRERRLERRQREELGS